MAHDPIEASLLNAAIEASANDISIVNAGLAAARTNTGVKSMFLSTWKMVANGVLAIGLTACGGWAGALQATEDQSAATPKTNQAFEFPKTPAPVQVLASIDKDKTLVIKTNVQLPDPGRFGSVRAQARVAGRPGAPAAPEITILPVLAFGEVHTLRYDLDKVEVFDTDGKKVEKSEIAKRLKKNPLAVASLLGEPVEASHLRVLKEGTLVFVPPAPAPAPAGVGGVEIPGPLPGAPGIPPRGFVPE
jgi:hypothetical protein